MDSTVDEVGSTIKIFFNASPWVFLAAIVSVFMPDQVAKTIGLLDFRNQWAGWFSLVLIGSFFLSVGKLYQSIKNYLKKRNASAEASAEKRSAREHELNVIAATAEQNRLDKKAELEFKEEKRKTQLAQKQDSIRLLLNGLTQDEKAWGRYCLIKNQMTINTHIKHATANSLSSKGLVIRGSGDAGSLPWTFETDVWQFMLSNKNTFLGEYQSDWSGVEAELSNFESSLRLFYG